MAGEGISRPQSARHHPALSRRPRPDDRVRGDRAIHRRSLRRGRARRRARRSGLSGLSQRPAGYAPRPCARLLGPDHRPRRLSPGQGRPGRRRRRPGRRLHAPQPVGSHTLKRRDLLAVAGLMAAAPIAAHAKTTKPVTAAQAIAAAMKEPALRPFRSQIEAAMRVLDAYIDGFNARSVEAFDAAFNFPSVRLANNTLRIINKGDQKASLFTTGSLADWDHTGW